MRYVLMALALVVAFSSGVWADKSLTYFTVALTDVSSVCFARDNNAQGWKATASGTVRASAGSGYATTISGPVTAGQKTSIESYITTNVVPALNTQEGL